MDVGSKFDKSLSTTQIAARVRADIKAAQKAGTISKAVKVSVRSEYFSGGSAIRINVKAAPFQVLSSEWVRHQTLHPHEYNGNSRFSSRATRLLEQLKAIAEEYNFDDSDTQTDYFHVKFYLTVGFDWEFEAEEREFMAAYFRALAAAPYPAALPTLRLVANG